MNDRTMLKNVLLNSAATSLASQALGSSISIIPTPMERAAGRLMRAPDHDAGTAGGGGATTEAGAGDPQAADTAATSDADKGADEAATGAGGAEGDAETIDLSKTAGAEEEQQTEETDEQKATREAAEAETAKFFGAPEGDAAYEITGLPEGTTVDTEALAAITPVAKQLGLSNEGLSLIASTYAKDVLPRVATQVVEGIQADIAEQRRTNEIEARAAVSGVRAVVGEDGKPVMKDGKPVTEKVELKNAAAEVLSFDGKNMKEVQQVAARALDRMAPEGFRAFLDETGLGLDPRMIAFCFQAGKAIKEETNFEPGGTDTRPKSREEKYYG